jgi:hypothetical protein
MTINEFEKDFLENSLLSLEQDGISQEDSITKDILEYIQDSGDIFEPELCHFKIRGSKINAYDYNDENETLDLFVTIFKNEPGKIADSILENAYDKVYNFYKEAKDGRLINKIDESEEVIFDLVQIIEQTKSFVKNVRIFVITNGRCSTHTIPKDREEDGVYLDFELWDIERVYQQYQIKAGKQKIEIDFLTNYNYRLKCLKMDDVSENVDEYLAILPGKILANIYDEYKQGLLEKNVRTFLQFRAKVNQGIRDTIRNEPDMFFAYNNGISSTAEKVTLFTEDGVLYIKSIDNWQIVNGGQTTASIYSTSMEKDADLSKVFVQMKLSVVKDKSKFEELVPKISKYANSQTAIKASDFSSNSKFHEKVQDFSRRVWMPNLTGGRATHKWFYERTRGQYLDERSKYYKIDDIKRFDLEYPKKWMFSKIDLAKYEMSWLQKPHEVSKGGEKNYSIYKDEILSKEIEYDESFYRKLVAKGILFKHIDKCVQKKNLGGYKANMTSYILALLSYKTNQKIDLEDIWNTQEINEELNQIVEDLIPFVWKHINDTPSNRKNIGEYCKIAECWTKLKDKSNNVKDINDKIVNFGGVTSSKIETEVIELNPEELKLIEEAEKISPELCFMIAKWAKDENHFTPFDRKLIYNIGVVRSRKKGLSIKQAKQALRIIVESYAKGYSDQ